MPIRTLPSAAILHSRFLYDPETGILTSRYTGRPIIKTNGKGYITVRVDMQECRAGRVIWKMMTGQDPRFTIDHINRSKNDNRWLNLRDVTIQVNNQNRDQHGRETYRCAICVRRVLNHGKHEWWYVHIPINYKYVYVGQFRDKVDAYRAFSEAAWKRHRGEPIRDKVGVPRKMGPETSYKFENQLDS